MAAGPAFLIAGTTSDAGKSVITAGLCRAFARAGLRVAPFKAQNMSNNSAVTSDGGEIGRAQALQALACGLEPSVEFNPILLKPGPDNRARLVIRGREQGDVGAGDYIRHRHDLRGIAAAQLESLRERFDIVVCEGAGSPAEINLRATDVANFGLAQAAQLAVYIVGDIDRGGVLAHLFGTHAIISDEDRALIRGFVINKFRGHQELLEPGLVQLEELTGVETKAVIPFIDDIWIDAEDSLQSPVGRMVGPGGRHPLGTQRLSVAAIRLPRMLGVTDVEALAVEPGVTVTWVDDVDAVWDSDLVIIPGTTATVADLAWLRHRGLDRALGERATRGMPILGIGGGYQMMATTITDEGDSPSSVAGLALFDVHIALTPHNIMVNHGDGSYEVHHGQVRHHGEQTWIEGEGARREALFGTHRHGYLQDDPARRRFLTEVATHAGKPGFLVSPDTSFHGVRLQQLDRIADVLEEHWDLDQLLDEVSRPANAANTPETR
ncbi:cobyric acid synthase CobQ [Corynebacterium efficiens YS-314]|uniref:Cobyric acid synthase n=1 Tax=Corynebacterium efficiens (strain DSM 44549 / YS-314 / AJ 12310 / JCM 11189 / NBRC 100395) TaxID=196164 RepID=COBQ_COREF|nr:cobyric acid synthase [Corynebacterium efficiens]Q8FP85.1 RecName: Full=Cobyric acid synthase [Corynebacterium efficiens YS-314]EEW49455.1 cobyric acid synthase CobQ [Corynebacterium efficiens YS-314]BAC18710.1 putative cobyric acid synthase [Corynebacterium efficiens YS-314]